MTAATREDRGTRLTTEVDGRVLVIRMCRDDKRNAVDAQMTAELDDALNRLEEDPALWCGVLAGGPPAFCAGTDLADGAGVPTARGGNYGVVRRRRSTPLIAAVEGFAFGGGFEIALACDMIVAGGDAQFGLPEVSRGVVANCGALFRGPRALPVNIAREMLLTGRPFPADRLAALGLVNLVVAPGAALENAVQLAEAVCANSPVAVGASLRAVDSAVSELDERGWSASDDAVAAIIDSADRAEGVAAFLEKRPTRWPGR